ncbi:hypothetical protein CDAR_239141 [Caerostris darwini]|uniref:Uncharacterized protein n=1 Tax=Caerostris darwini TaxID=1538125 RepID=A0AAV4NYT1_9ARAC|nr:hypothetical protein CDAR_239141 [Caerostris darwini]
MEKGSCERKGQGVFFLAKERDTKSGMTKACFCNVNSHLARVHNILWPSKVDFMVTQGRFNDPPRSFLDTSERDVITRDIILYNSLYNES